MPAAADPTDLHGEKDAANARALAADAASKLELDDLRWLMGHRQGRRIAWRVLERGHVYRTSFNTNALAMANSEGERNVGLWFLSQVLEAAPEAHLSMLKEHKQ